MWDKVKQEILKFRQAPKWRQYVIGAIIVFGLIYGVWTLWGYRPQKPSDGYKPTTPLIDTPKVDGPTLQVPVKIIPAAVVKKKLPRATKRDSQEWVDTADIPPAPNGAKVVTKIDTITGETTNDVEINSAPWFAFERGNTVGAAYEAGTQGNKAAVYYKRDVLRIKDVHVVGEAGAKIALDPMEKSEAYGRVGLEWRF